MIHMHAHLAFDLSAGLAQRQNVQQCGFAGPAGPKQCHTFSRVGIPRGGVQHLRTARYHMSPNSPPCHEQLVSAPSVTISATARKDLSCQRTVIIMLLLY